MYDKQFPENLGSNFNDVTRAVIYGELQLIETSLARKSLTSGKKNQAVKLSAENLKTYFQFSTFSENYVFYFKSSTEHVKNWYFF